MTLSHPSGRRGERVYSDREVIELFRMLLRAQIREERINSIEELYGLLRHVDAALGVEHTDPRGPFA